MEQNAKGAGFLKVTGILMIIGGIIGIVLSIFAFVGVAALQMMASDEMNFGIYYVACIMSLVGAALQLVAGIIGVINAKKPEKAMTCIVWGAIVAVLSVLGNVIFIISGAQSSVPSLLVGLVLPVLFIVGGVKNRQG